MEDHLNGVSQEDIRYLRLLSKHYPNVQAASTEIINLQAIMNLPKGTEFFLSDLHGEYESFTHMLRNGSGIIRQKIQNVFGYRMTEEEKTVLATLIYYPEQRLEIVKNSNLNISQWYETTLYKLISVCREVSSKYSRSKVRKALPEDFAFIIEELLQVEDSQDKADYYSQIIKTIIEIERADAFIIAISKLIQKLAVDRLHILGDIFDRGPGPHIIMDALMDMSSVDIQWGNHDILWIGAACGSEACIANAIRIAASYSNLETIEDGYGISLSHLAAFANETYKEDACLRFMPKGVTSETFSEKESSDIAKLHKAIAIIQFKLEAEIINRRFGQEMKDRLLLDKMNLAEGLIHISGHSYGLLDTHFPTVDPGDPFRLTEEEQEVVHKLKRSFLRSEKLQKHAHFLLKKGSMYKVYNSNLLYHGCIMLDDNGEFKKVEIDGALLSGKALIDQYESFVRDALCAAADSNKKLNGLDYVWYMWTGANSPLYGKNRMATFERYFIADKETHIEVKNAYYKYRDSEEVCNRIFQEFGLDPRHSHIINGHVPVIMKKGESPVKANGKLLVIDGGLSKAYQPKTGIAGYTLAFNSHGLVLFAHEPFISIQNAIDERSDIVSSASVVEHAIRRIKVADTDAGKELIEDVKALKLLLKAYRHGMIKEHNA